MQSVRQFVSVALSLSLSSLRHLVFMPISMKFLTCLQTVARLQLQLHVLSPSQALFLLHLLVLLLFLFACAASAKTGPVPFHDFTLMR